MSLENQRRDQKSLRTITGRTADFRELAKDCVCFANARGGQIAIGIEDGESEPPARQSIASELLDRVRQRIGELTVNVAVAVEKHTAGNGGQCILITVYRSEQPASTTDGRYYLRISDDCKPLVGTDIQRLMDERNAQPWELLTSLGIPAKRADRRRRDQFCKSIRNSERVHASVKDKSDSELLQHYRLIDGGLLTNLGILIVGSPAARAKLGTAPIVQVIKFDEDGNKVKKWVWDDYSLTAIELVEVVYGEVSDFHESYELPDGLFRQSVPAFDERVVREVLVNALVHRPYTCRGDIYLNLHPGSLTIVNPGLLPLGVTPRNILHQSVRRNTELARVFHDLKLMEREGSGFDLLYDVLTSQGKPPPTVREVDDRVEVTIPRRFIKAQLIDFLDKADRLLPLRQRERIALGILVQHDSLTARELAEILELNNTAQVAAWIGRLIDWRVVKQTGRTKGTRYFVDHGLVTSLDFPSPTDLRRIEPHRLRELVREDLSRHPASLSSEIQSRIGPEIGLHRIRDALKSLIQAGQVRYEGERRWRRYWLRDD